MCRALTDDCFWSDFFLTKSIEKLVALSGRREAALKKKCQDTLSIIKEIGEDVRSHGTEPEKIQNLQWISNQLVSLFGVATESRNPEIVSTALDGLHKLLAYKWIRGSFHDEEDPEHRRLIDKVIDKRPEDPA